MLLIDCPHCGPRNEVEYAYGGQAHVARPEDPYALDDREWAEHLSTVTTPAATTPSAGTTGGCRKWFNAIRDTATYEFRATYPAGTSRPGTGSGAPSDGASSASSTHEGVQP